MSDIMCYQLMNGQDIMGTAFEAGTTIIMKEPAAIHLVPAKSGGNQFGIALMPFVPYADLNRITIQKDKIVLSFAPTDELLNNYSKLFGSGIEIVSAMPR